MKTSDAGTKFTNISQHKNSNILGSNHLEDLHINPLDPNEERIVSAYRPKEKVFFYDNSSICKSYGQSNLEKCLFIVFVLITYSICLIYKYWEMIDQYLYGSILSNIGIDAIVLIFYLYFLMKLKSDQVFNMIPKMAISISDWLILINLIGETVTMVLVSLSIEAVGFSGLGFFLFKYFLEFYFTAVAVKMFVFCPFSRALQEQTERLWSTVKYYLFCCEADTEPENPEYTKIEDIESFY